MSGSKVSFAERVEDLLQLSSRVEEKNRKHLIGLVGSIISLRISSGKEVNIESGWALIGLTASLLGHHSNSLDTKSYLPLSTEAREEILSRVAQLYADVQGTIKNLSPRELKALLQKLGSGDPLIDILSAFPKSSRRRGLLPPLPLLPGPPKFGYVELPAEKIVQFRYREIPSGKKAAQDS